MPLRLLIAAAALGVSGAIAAAEPASFSDLQGLTLQADWTEDMTFRPEKAPSPRNVRSPRQLTLVFGPGDAIKHKLFRVAGEQQRTENREMELGKTQTSAVGLVQWAFDKGNLVYIETMYTGARRLIVKIDKTDGKLTCSISAQVAREGNKPVMTLGLDNKTKLELIEVKATGGNCAVKKE